MWTAPQQPRTPALDRLTLVLKEQELHTAQGEGLPEAVRHRVLLLLEDLGDLGVPETEAEPHVCTALEKLGVLMAVNGPGGDLVLLCENDSAGQRSGGPCSRAELAWGEAQPFTP